ncbi:large conductance mechanosensitive channel protein MscL [Quadrisphaera setariae]|uniref:Large conductance mechanosensitive channel protein MscL n=1 Tax=Quadrisphaera setariae TaxID=2593304 RepID=A0A5C8ZHT9_9ACTN|nr:large conductance mechanosensitive channel protein MscL [Quadrisphaera setariae]TXR57124.1 large conductance mechanosensitive channel protein MscL [Quadrisphaera setariae]
MKGFREFILRGNVVDLAIAVLIGAAFGALVKSFTDDMLTPLLGVFGGVEDFSSLHFAINGSEFRIGAFINAIIAFLITAAILYFFVVKPVNALMARYRTQPEPKAPVHECPECLSKIPVKATRCAFCTAQVAPAA